MRCAICGEQRDLKTVKYCSWACRDKGRNHRFSIACEWCSEPFIAKRYREKTARYCSVACKQMAHKEKHRPVTVKCELCHREHNVKPHKVSVTRYCHDCTTSIGVAAKPMPIIAETELELFWSRVDMRGADECWPWLGTISHSGHGRLRLPCGMFAAHRLSYFIATGDDPGMMVICHSCVGHPECVNPKHLSKGTVQDNTRHRDMDNRTARGDTSGPRTHPETTARGDANGNRVLNSEQVAAIIEQHKTGQATRHQLAASYMVHYETIARILRREAWAHLPR